MEGTVALVREQGRDFAVMVVGDDVIEDPVAREQMLEFGLREWGVPTALLGKRDRQAWGPDEILAWLETVPIARLPWRRFRITN